MSAAVTPEPTRRAPDPPGTGWNDHLLRGGATLAVLGVIGFFDSARLRKPDP